MLALSALLRLPAFAADAAPPPDMVLIPEGTFVMGTDEVDERREGLALGMPHPWYEDEHPRREIRLPAFYMDAYEASNARYASFIEATGRQAPADWIDGAFPPEKADHPVVYVSWDDADAYCRWAGKRLPTEAEWEKAARGAKGLKYPWGNEFEPERANISAQPSLGGGTTAPVGKHESGKSPYGVHDLIGNVWEWTASWYQAYPGNDMKNEKFGERLRVCRGLSFMGIGHYPPELYRKVSAIVARASFRSFDAPTSKLPDVGFRCAKDAP